MTTEAVSTASAERGHAGSPSARSVAGYLYAALVLFFRDNAMGMAGMIAFFAFLALVPLVLLTLAFVGAVPHELISARQVESMFHDVVPGLTQRQFSHTYWNPLRHSRVTTTILGVATLLIGSMGFHDSIDWAVNRIWKARRTRPMWVGKLRGLAIILWVVAFVVLSLTLTWLWAQLLIAAHAGSLLKTGEVMLFPTFLLDIAIAAALYKLTPTAPVDLTSALAAGGVAALLWGASKFVFGWWVLEVGTYNRVYGPLAASVIVMLWIWISAMIFLYGAELCVVLQRHRETSVLRWRRQPGSDGDRR